MKEKKKEIDFNECDKKNILNLRFNDEMSRNEH